MRSIEDIAPFRRTADHHQAIPAAVEGSVPDWLRGNLIRTCPAVFETGSWRAQHWFDGLGMIYAFGIRGATIDFRSRLLDSEAARDAWRGEANLASYGTPTERPLLRRFFEPVPRVSDNTNVNIVRMGPELVAMTEGDRQLVIDDLTLASTGAVPYSRATLPGGIMTAHPQFDFARDMVVNVASQFSTAGVISVYEHAPAARERRVVGSWRTERVPYVHTFGLTPQHAILVAHPFAVTPVKMLWSSRGYIDHFEWRPQQGTQLVVIDRVSGATRVHLTEPFFAFHTVNAFERGESTLLDLLAYPDAGIVDAMRPDRMRDALPDLRPSLLRITMRRGSERASVETLGDVGFEFPSVHHQRVGGRPYRFAYGASNGPDAGAYGSAVVKVDLESGRSHSYSDGSHIYGEPVFVANPQGNAEDDGVLLSVGSAKDAASAVLAILDAKTLQLIARAQVPSSIPLGFHGSFVRQHV